MEVQSVPQVQLSRWCEVCRSIEVERDVRDHEGVFGPGGENGQPGQRDPTQSQTHTVGVPDDLHEVLSARVSDPNTKHLRKVRASRETGDTGHDIVIRIVLVRQVLLQQVSCQPLLVSSAKRPLV